MGELELKELEKIRDILTLAHSEALEKELSKIATTIERKKAWVLIDGKLFPKDIAKKAGKIKKRAVYEFLEELANAGWIKNPSRKPPMKRIDYVPRDWLKLFEK